MERELQIFNHEAFGDVRVVMSESDEPWFCLKDVCKSLDLRSNDVNQRLSDEVVTTHPIVDRLGRTQKAVFINEDGLYDVILDSRKPEAKAFRKWVTSVVLPSIRKNGGYLVGQEQEEDPEKIMAKALIYAQNRITEIESRNNALSSENKELRVRIGEMDRAIQKIAPQSACYRKFMDCEDYVCSFRELGIKLQMNERRFREKLEEFGYVKPTRKRLEPMKKYSDKGMLILRTVEYQEGRFGEQMFFTPKGIGNIVETFVKHGVLEPDTLEIIKINKPSAKKTENNNFGQKPINFN